MSMGGFSQPEWSPCTILLPIFSRSPSLEEGAGRGQGREAGGGEQGPQTRGNSIDYFLPQVFRAIALFFGVHFGPLFKLSA